MAVRSGGPSLARGRRTARSVASRRASALFRSGRRSCCRRPRCHYWRHHRRSIGIPRLPSPSACWGETTSGCSAWRRQIYNDALRPLDSVLGRFRSSHSKCQSYSMDPTFSWTYEEETTTTPRRSPSIRNDALRPLRSFESNSKCADPTFSSRGLRKRIVFSDRPIRHSSHRGTTTTTTTSKADKISSEDWPSSRPRWWQWPTRSS